jgi:NAD(P)-dependent dehydrogenase (short-subunit alcohol dehydrogenase family)
VVVADVSKEDQCAAFVEQVVAEHGEIDHAISCFGAWWQGGAWLPCRVALRLRVRGKCGPPWRDAAAHDGRAVGGGGPPALCLAASPWRIHASLARCLSLLATLRQIRAFPV